MCVCGTGCVVNAGSIGSTPTLGVAEVYGATVCGWLSNGLSLRADGAVAK